MDSWSYPRGARPVADAPIVDGMALAKAWLLALIARAPLAQAAVLPAADLARDAPALCEALVEALRDDTALDRLRPGGDRFALAGSAGVLAGARDAAGAAAAVDALRTVTWGVLRDALPPDPDPRLVGDLAERLALVGAVLSAATLEHGVAAPEPVARPVAAPGEAPFLVPDAQRVERDPWLRPVDFALARHARDGTPFSVLLADLDEVERLVAAEVGRELADAVEQVERAIRAQLRGEDALVRERIGRYWIVAAGLPRAPARDFAHRIADAVAASASLHGAPLTVSVGLAVCPDDGVDADSLAAHADEGVFAARAAGVRLA